MKKNSLLKFAVVTVLLSAIISCKTVSQPESVYVPVDYTEEDAVKDQIEYVLKMSEKDVIRAVWRSKILVDNASENIDALAAFEKCCENAANEMNKKIEEKDFFSALRIARSLSAVSYSSPAMKMTETQVEDEAYRNVPGKGKSSGSKESVTKLISGTVTVYVDKGIKIQRGVGYADSVLGSGFFISKDGYIITNHHVISDMVNKKYEGYSRLYIKLADDPDTRIPAKVIGYDSTIDLALIKTEVEAPYVFALGSSSDLSVGDKVYAIGSPLGLEKTLTSGIISSVDRQLFTAGTVFQIDAAVNSGNSGGPLVDEQGRVQAVVFAGVANYQGLNFAIPVEYLKNELPFLYAGGERKHPWIGAYGKTKRLPGAGSKREGVNVFYCLPGGSADLVGIREDDTIVAINGMKINSLDELHVAMMKLESNIISKVTVSRQDGTKVEKLVYLATRPSSPGYEVFRHDDLGNALYPMLGMRLVSSSTMNRKQYMITKIIKGSIADETGFSENDPVVVHDVSFMEGNSGAVVTLYAKKRKNGFLDVSVRVPAPMDSPYYF
ncbi:S1C family serine protease [Treponema sp.]|uniref:S1C family serine protease n=1 Tax=Treponema sp. TaxID=166 RepID=UPI00298E3A22|nr:S1C family serine protease [Treponema sp.]MCQ2240537.1 S1C family serine protease [Treponema sp.]